MLSKLSFRTLVPLVLFVTALAFTLSYVSETVGMLPAVGLYLALGSVPLALCPSLSVLGAAATEARNTEMRPGDMVYLPLAADTVVFSGTLAARDADGNVVPASDTAGLRVIGRAEETVNNTDGLAGALSICVRLGCYKFANSATNAVDADDIGKMAVVEDDQTVAETSTYKVSAGRITGVDSDGVWVDTRFAFYGPKTVPALTSTDGTMAAAADDAATKAEGEKIGDDVRALHASLFG